MYKFNVHVDMRWDSGGADIYILQLAPNEKQYILTLKDGMLERKELEIGIKPEEPFFSLNQHNVELLQAFAEGLKRAGYVAEVDNAQRITAEAVSKEREKQIEWFKRLIEKQL